MKRKTAIVLKDSEILEAIESIIKKNYPIITTHPKTFSHPLPALEIHLNLASPLENSQIYFFTGNEIAKRKLDDTFLTNNIISPSLIIELISFILAHQHIIKDFRQEKDQITITFTGRIDAINFGFLNLTLNFKQLSHHQEYSSLYFQKIFWQFLADFKPTPTFQAEYLSSLSELKTHTLNNLTFDELITFFKNIPFLKLQKIIYQDDALFLSLYRTYNSDQNPTLIRTKNEHKEDLDGNNKY